MVATGKAKVDDFKFMLHLCGWAPGQLQAEIDRGVWLPVASSANVSYPNAFNAAFLYACRIF